MEYDMIIIVQPQIHQHYRLVYKSTWAYVVWHFRKNLLCCIPRIQKRLKSKVCAYDNLCKQYRLWRLLKEILVISNLYSTPIKWTVLKKWTGRLGIPCVRIIYFFIRRCVTDMTSNQEWFNSLKELLAIAVATFTFFLEIFFLQTIWLILQCYADDAHISPRQ